MNLLQRIIHKVTDQKSGLLHEYSITEEVIPALPPTPVKPPEVWEIRWKRYINEYMPHMTEEVNVFYSTEEAKAFENALKEAYKLTKHTRLLDTVTHKKIK